MKNDVMTCLKCTLFSFNKIDLNFIILWKIIYWQMVEEDRTSQYLTENSICMYSFCKKYVEVIMLE